MALIFAYLGFINNQWLSIYSQHCANALLSLFTIVVFLADEQPRLGHKFLCYKKSIIAYRATPMMVPLSLIAVAEYWESRGFRYFCSSSMTNCLNLAVRLLFVFDLNATSQLRLSL
uniref:Uncharacterized protein n=2 Tax=Proteus mirabilis TaxID=584 RepID=A0A1L5JMZ0_PROMI|nr:hypothetical protein [Proteus mirabilis]